MERADVADYLPSITTTITCYTIFPSDNGPLCCVPQCRIVQGAGLCLWREGFGKGRIAFVLCYIFTVTQPQRHLLSPHCFLIMVKLIAVSGATGNQGATTQMKQTMLETNTHRRICCKTLVEVSNTIYRTSFDSGSRVGEGNRVGSPRRRSREDRSHRTIHSRVRTRWVLGRLRSHQFL